MSRARLSLWILLALFAAAVSPVPSAGASSGGAVPSGSELQGAHDLGDVAERSDAVFVRTRLEDVGGSAASAGDWRDYCFELSADRKVGLGLRRLDRDADLYLLSDGGDELASGRAAGTAGEWVEVSLRAGDYCARVVAVDVGENHFVFRYGTGPPDLNSLLPAATATAPDPGAEPGTHDPATTTADPDPGTEPGTGTSAPGPALLQARGESVWSATVQADAVGALDGHEYVGYSAYSRSGALRGDSVDDDHHPYTVFALASSETAQTLVLMATLPRASGLALQVGEHRFAIADAAPPSPTGARPSEAGDVYLWDAPGLGWSAGDEIEARFLVEPADRDPNVVLILADDLGWGDVRANNPDSRIATPNIDSIAEAGVRFTDAHSPSSVCTGTRYGLLTGRYSWRTHLTEGVLAGYSSPLITPDYPTLGTLLQGRGHRTAAIGKWHLGLRISWLSKPLTRTVIDGPLQHGFDEFFGLSANVNWRPTQYIETDRFTTTPDARSILDRLTAESVGFIERAARDDQPFFLYFPLTAPHQPLVPAGRFQGRTGLGRYGDFIAQVDWTVGEILAAVDRVGARDDTIVIFASDNGSFMGTSPNHAADHTEDPAHRRYRPENHQANGPWRDGKGSVYEGGHRVPLIMQWPSLLAAGSTVDAAVSLTDLWATLAEAVGEQPGPGAAPDSVSLWPLLRGETAGRGLPVVLHSNRGTFAIRDGPWKLVLGVGSGKRGDRNSGPPFSTPWQLYNLSEDPGETLDLVDRRPEVVTRLSAALDAIRAETHTVTTPRRRPPLTGAFEGAPGSHDGATAFSFRVAFTEPVDVTADGLRDDVLAVTGGAVTDVEAVGDDGTAWEVTLTPDSALAAVVTVEAGTGCESPRAVCTAGGRRLSERMRLYVQGPGNTLAAGRPAVSGTLTSEPTAAVAAAPPWHATMTVGEAVNANGYNGRAGSLTRASFDIDGTSYTLTEILAWEFMYITVDNALPEGYVLEVDGEQFALEDADAAGYGYGTVYYWDDADLTWPQGATVRLALYPAG